MQGSIAVCGKLDSAISLADAQEIARFIGPCNALANLLSRLKLL
jgi:hypothetical protein